MDSEDLTQKEGDERAQVKDTQFCSTNEEPATSEDVPPTEEVEAKLPDDEHKDGEKAHKEGSKATFAMSKQMTALLRRDVEDDFRDEDPEKIIKVVVLGDGTSGKTSMCTRFAQRDYVGKYSQTVGVDFFSRRICLPRGINVLFQLWDVGGQSIAANMLGKYIFDANCIIFVYDVTNMSTFESVTDWLTVVKKLTSKQERPIHMCLIGNKTDMEHRRTVRIDKHTRFADQYGMGSHYISAKTGDSVDLTFKLIAAEVLGIQLSKIDVELAISAIEAPVAVLDEPDSNEPKKPVPQIKPTVMNREQEGTIDMRKDYSKQSSVCSLQ